MTITLLQTERMKAQRREAVQDNKSTLLLVEDEHDLRELLSFTLTREGFRVTAVETGEQGLEECGTAAPDLIVLDLMLPGIDGLEVCRRLKARPETAAVPVVMLTAKGEEADVVAGLELGADDYVTKPFSPRVLTARLKAVLRRRSEKPAEDDGQIRVGGLLIRPDRHEVIIHDRKVDLTATEFKLLTLLARRPGRVFTRAQIIESIHGQMTAVTDRSVDVQVLTLRRKLGDKGDVVQTVRGVGYRLGD